MEHQAVIDFCFMRRRNAKSCYSKEVACIATVADGHDQAVIQGQHGYVDHCIVSWKEELTENKPVAFSKGSTQQKAHIAVTIIIGDGQAIGNHTRRFGTPGKMTVIAQTAIIGVNVPITGATGFGGDQFSAAIATGDTRHARLGPLNAAKALLVFPRTIVLLTGPERVVGGAFQGHKYLGKPIGLPEQE